MGRGKRARRILRQYSDATGACFEHCFPRAPGRGSGVLAPWPAGRDFPTAVVGFKFKFGAAVLGDLPSGLRAASCQY